MTEDTETRGRDAQIKPNIERIEIDNPGGDPDPIAVKYKTRLQRGEYYDAWEAAAMAFKDRYGDFGGLSLVALEKELAVRIIDWWNLKLPPGAGGWEALDKDIGDRLVDDLGIRDIMEDMQDGGAPGEELTDAKN